MAAVNEAYEVLSNDGMYYVYHHVTFTESARTELRARFDNGDDPNDPTSGQGSHAHPFQQGGNPFQNVFFQQSGFKFSFNHH
jgi:DnaJ homolog subfamily C member 3